MLILNTIEQLFMKVFKGNNDKESFECNPDNTNFKALKEFLQTDGIEKMVAIK
jgi:hypothetical protein